MVTVIKAPSRYDKEALQKSFSIFLAGSIDNGASRDWQKELTEKLREWVDFDDEYRILLFNPRREKWDSTLTQSIDNSSFLQQVTWEQHHLNIADFRIFYFTKDSKAPITFMELGQMITRPGIICCENGFYRTGNLEINAILHGMPIVDNMDALVKYLKVVVSAKQI